MHSVIKCATVMAGCFIVAALLIAPQARGDEWNLATRFTVNHPFEVPKMVLLPNTPYVIRVLDSPSNRNVVQIYDGDQTHMLTMFMAIAAERPEPADETVFTFIETERGFPLPIQEWFYPGRTTGLEFVYPKEQAREIASHAREAVLSAELVDLHDLKAITVESVEPGQTSVATAVATAESNTKAVETIAAAQAPEVSTEPIGEPVEQPAAQQEPVAQQEPAVEKSTEVAQNAPAEVEPQEQEVQPIEPAAQAEEAPQQTAAITPAEENQQLPRTAGELPLIGLIGLRISSRCLRRRRASRIRGATDRRAQGSVRSRRSAG
jgi:hypothetical protein